VSARRSDGDDFGTVSRRRFIRSSVLLGGGLAGTAGVGRVAHAGGRPAARVHRLDVREFGAVGDGETKDTAAIQRAIDGAAQAGGGVVELPAGTWLSGTVHLRSRVTLELAAGATLLASPDDDDFASPERLGFATACDVETTDFAHALLAGRKLEHVAIVGDGVIDMSRDERCGPKPIALKRCRWVTVRGVTILRSPNYCVSLGGCEDVLIDGVTIREAFADGIDPDCCRRVRIVDCDVEADDDALCLKASFHLGVRGVTEDVVVANCRLRSPSNCFKLGTESTGDFRQIVLSNCVFSGLPPENHDLTAAAEGAGIALLAVDGGTIDGVVVSNVVMSGVPAPFFVRLGNRGRDQPEPVPGCLRNVSISGIVAVGAKGTGSIVGLLDHPVEHVTLDNVRISGAGGSARAEGLAVPERASEYPKATMYGRLPAYGLYLRHVRDVVLRNLAITAERDDSRPALVADDVGSFHLVGLAGRPGNGAGPVVWLNEVRGALVQGNLAPEDVDVFLRLTGEGTRDVALVGNAHWKRDRIQLAPEIEPDAVMHLAGNRDGGRPS
jgi:hypothetical protein